MPDEYISREAALTALQDSDLFNTTERQLRAIRELPAADVAQVVRCRDCAAWKETLALSTARTDTVSSTILIQTGRISAATENIRQIREA